MQIDEMRNRIDTIDAQIASLFAERMEIAAEIGKIKKESAVPVLDGQREKKVMENAASCVPANLKKYVMRLFAEIMSISRDIQNKL